MQRNLFGHNLGRLVNLNEHDIQEILQDQTSSRRRFGEVALAWGLCQPQDVWRAWWQQLVHLRSEINLVELGIDAQSVLSVPKPVAIRYNVVPVRSLGDEIVVAADPATAQRAGEDLPTVLARKVKVVLADPSQISNAIQQYYDRIARPTSIAS